MDRDETKIKARIYMAGEKSAAACHHCASVMPTTFAVRDVPVEGSIEIVRQIMVGVCDGCGLTVSIPAMSAPAIRHVLRSPRPA